MRYEERFQTRQFVRYECKRRMRRPELAQENVNVAHIIYNEVKDLHLMLVIIEGLESTLVHRLSCISVVLVPKIRRQ
jgi:hypothetical protein